MHMTQQAMDIMVGVWTPIFAAAALIVLGACLLTIAAVLQGAAEAIIAAIKASPWAKEAERRAQQRAFNADLEHQKDIAAAQREAWKTKLQNYAAKAQHDERLGSGRLVLIYPGKRVVLENRPILTEGVWEMSPELAAELDHADYGADLGATPERMN
jgi:hypothetical protein